MNLSLLLLQKFGLSEKKKKKQTPDLLTGTFLNKGKDHLIYYSFSHSKIPVA